MLEGMYSAAAGMAAQQQRLDALSNDMANATNIDQTQISELPINGRRASDFARLTPGVNPEGDFGLNSFRLIKRLTELGEIPPR